jgi:hypothetical protein
MELNPALLRRTKDRCVSCGRRIECSPRGLPNHHCSERHEARVAAANRRAEEDGRELKPSYSQRLRVGFLMLRGQISTVIV